MTVELTLAKVRETMAAAVAERGEDYDYRAHHESCRYTRWVTDHTGKAEQKPGCLVGEVLHRLGVPLDVLYTWDDSGVDDLMSHLADRHRLDDNPWITYADDEATEYVDGYLRVAQDIQDCEGNTWGMALRHAESRLADAQRAAAERDTL